MCAYSIVRGLDIEGRERGVEKVLRSIGVGRTKRTKERLRGKRLHKEVRKVGIGRKE